MKRQLRYLGAFGIVTGIAFATAIAEPPPGLFEADPEGINTAIEAQKRHTRSLRLNKGVLGTGVSWDQVEATAVVKIFTNRPNINGLPSFIDGKPVVVENIGDVKALGYIPQIIPDESTAEPLAGGTVPTDRFDRPVPIGVSVGHPGVTAGTLGCRVNAGCHNYILSNNHVIAGSNNAAINDNILQPGVYDGGLNPADTVGYLEAFVPLVFIPLDNRGFPDCGGFREPDCPENDVDAAIAFVELADVQNSTPANGYGTPSSQTITPYVGQKVMKYGRTTGLTYGYIDSINVNVDVAYGSNTARFDTQILIKPAPGVAAFASPGDSGSLIVAADANYPQEDCVTDPQAAGYPCAPEYPPVDEERKGVGLLFASGTLGGNPVTIANHIDIALTELGVTIDGD